MAQPISYGGREQAGGGLPRGYQPSPHLTSTQFRTWYEGQQMHARSGTDQRTAFGHPDPAHQTAFDLLRNFDSHVLFEDEHLLVLNKPANIASHTPSEGGKTPGVLDVVNHVLGNAPDVELAHRLDKPTTGLLVITKTPQALIGMKEQFGDKGRSHMVKTYLALVEGEWTTKAPQEVAIKVRPRRGNPRYMEAIPLDTPFDPDARTALSYFSQVAVLRRGQTRPDQQQIVTLMEIDILTGRTHQIRVSAQHANHPLVGDTMYGGSATAARPMLHAARLQFNHPVTGKRMDLRAPLPADFLRTVNDGTRWEY